MRRTRAIVLCTFVGLAAACGGVNKPADSAAAPTAQAPKTAQEAPNGGASSAARPSAPMQRSDAIPASPTNDMMPAWDDFERARIQLDESNGCFSACRALKSMDRSAGRVCDLTREGSRCEDVKSAVVRARAKVKATCQSCLDGTSTDSRAPIPAP